MKRYIRIGVYVWIGVMMVGCSTAAIEHIDKPQERKIKKSLTIETAIKHKDMEAADKLYLAYRGKHPESNKLPSYMLKLSKAHMKKKEYLLARYYAEAYITDYPSGRRVDQAWFLRVKSLFLRFKDNSSSQSLADQLREESKLFLDQFTRSKYRVEIKKMRKESQEIIKARNEEIAQAYERMGKKKAAEYYRNKNKK